MRLRMLTRSVYGIALAIISCVSTPKFDDTSQATLSPTNNSLTPEIAASTGKSGRAQYTFGEKNFSAQWIECISDPRREAVAVFHRFEAGFDPNLFCNGWVAQALIQAGYNVIAVNRPSYGESTGIDDFSGPQSIVATEAGIRDSGISNIVGSWGFDTGSIAAAFFAKKYKGLKWVMLGAGFYDMELSLKQTSNSKIKNSIAKVIEREGDTALEKRSIAWDLSGLPKMVAIYHAKGDTVAPHQQADAFNDQLRTSEYKVYHSEISTDAHELPWRDHFKIARLNLEKFKTN